MTSSTFFAVAVAILVFALISRKLERSVLTPPMAFVGIGYLIGADGWGLIGLEAEPLIHILAEITLVLVLFTDAARIDLALLRRDHDLPVRMLIVGLPLTILAGLGVAMLLFPEWGLFEAAVLATVLAPTDAALGQAVVSSPAVPVRIRQALNVESGLNDGIALPVVLIFLASAGAVAGDSRSPIQWAQFTALQVVLGPAVGILIGGLGGRLVSGARRKQWMGESFSGLSILALALISFSAAELVCGNGFIAAFVGGLTLGNTSRGLCTCCFEFGEEEGTLLALLTFLLFGAALLPDGLHHVQGKMVLYSVLSLTLIRMIPVAAALAGKNLSKATVAFLGWFGPRGLATILFGLLVVGTADLPHEKEILATAVVTVLLSTVAHGMTAYPLAKIYGAYIERRRSEEERRKVCVLPSRHTPGVRGTS